MISLLKKLYGLSTAFKAKEESKTLRWQGNKLFQLKTVGASFYHDAIQKITNIELGKSAFLFCTATLIPEDDNPHDSNAVKVVIEGYKVGYLSRDFAVKYRSYFKKFNIHLQNVTCDAVITSGFSSSEKTYNFVIELDIPEAPSAPLTAKPSQDYTLANTLDFNLKTSVDGIYHITTWLDYYAIDDMHPKKRIHTWTTDDWDTINYYLQNSKGIGLGHKLFSIPKTEHYKMFGNNIPEASILSINGRFAHVILSP